VPTERTGDAAALNGAAMQIGGAPGTAGGNPACFFHFMRTTAILIGAILLSFTALKAATIERPLYSFKIDALGVLGRFV
jgi:hypothetical protein